MKTLIARKKRIRLSRIFIIHFLVLFLFFVSTAQAAGIVPCDGFQTPCDFNQFIKLVQNFINYLILVSIPLTALIFAYSGFLMLTSVGSEEKIKHAKSIFSHVLIGFLFILGAWLIVYTISTSLLSAPQDYILLTK